MGGCVSCHARPRWKNKASNSRGIGCAQRDRNHFGDYLRRERETTFKRVTWAIFNAVAVTAAGGTAVRLTVTGHTLQIGGLLLAVGSIIAAVLLQPGGRLRHRRTFDLGRAPLRSVEPESSIGPQHELLQAA